MKLTLKLVLAIAAAIFVVLGVATWIDVEDEREELLADTAQDHLYFARTIRSLAETAWARAGARAAIEQMRVANAQDRPFDTELVGYDGQPHPGAGHPLAAPSELVGLRYGHDVTIVDRTRMLTYSALNAPGANGVAIQVAQSIDSQEDFLRGATVHAVRGGALAALGCILLVVLLGWVLVGRPVLALRAALRRIGQGDLATPLRLQQADEMGELAADIDAMRERLVEARDVAANEGSARVVALEALRHADRLRTVGQLAASLAHELGTPLNVVLGRARMIEAAPVPAATREHATAIAEQCTRMSGLIRQLLDFARAREPQKRAVDVREVARDAVQMLGPLARRRKIEFRLELADKACRASVDPSQLSQALTNLMVNAVQSAPDGGVVTIGVRTRTVAPPPEMQTPSAEHVELSVHDAGPGIETELLPRLFEPFFTTKTSDEGTGLGLSVAHGIVRDHDGFIDVESVAGKGATFRILIPALR